MRDVGAAQENLDDLRDLDRSGPADVDLDDDRLHRSDEPGRRERLAGELVDFDLAHEIGDVDAFSYSLDSTNDCEGASVECLRRALRKPTALSVRAQGPWNADDVPRAVNDASNRRIVRREPSPADEAQPIVSPFRQRIEQLVRVDVSCNLDVDALAEARHSQGQRRTEHHARLGVKALRIVKRQSQPAKSSWQSTNQVEMGQERGSPELLVNESVASGFALTGDGARMRVPVRRVGRDSGLCCPEVTQLDESLLAHR